MSGGAVVHPLEAEELVDRREGEGIRGRDPDLPAAR
jgi:hypothetical protein